MRRMGTVTSNLNVLEDNGRDAGNTAHRQFQRRIDKIDGKGGQDGAEQKIAGVSGMPLRLRHRGPSHI